MIERVQIPKDVSCKSFIEPKPAWVRDVSDNLYIRCGGCGLLMGLCHDIADNGDVNPSLYHDEPKCGWHVHGTLLDWDKGKTE